MDYDDFSIESEKGQGVVAAGFRIDGPTMYVSSAELNKEHASQQGWMNGVAAMGPPES